MKRRRLCIPVGGFTLIELLTVLALIGLLAAMILPTAQSVRQSVAKARTRMQFSQWAAAFENYRQEFGVYPPLAGGGHAGLVNDGATSNLAGSHPFHDQLAGARRDGGRLRSPTETGATENRRGVAFMTFADSDFVRAYDVTDGHNEPSELNLLRDAFHNTAIAVVIDGNLDGRIDSADVAGGLPAVTPQGGTQAVRPSFLESGTGGIQAGVIFYSALPGATSERDLIRSWR